MGAVVSLILHGLIVIFVTMKIVEMKVSDEKKPKNYGIFELFADMGGLYYFLVTSASWILALPIARNTTGMLFEKMYGAEKKEVRKPRCFDWKYLLACCCRDREV